VAKCNRPSQVKSRERKIVATELQRMRGPLTCKVCTHADVGVINVALARGAAAPTIAAKFPTLSVHSLYRHLKNHLAGPVLDRLRVKSLATIVGKNLTLSEIVANENQTLLAQIIALKSSLLTSIQAAEVAGAGTLVSSLVGRLTDLLTLESRILGQVTTGSTTIVNNYIASESFIRCRAAIVSALRPYPDAALAVSRALLQIESQPTDVDVVDAFATDISGSPAEAAALPVPAVEVGAAAPSVINLEQESSSGNFPR
jgi:hypothetical protein